ncbi:MAG TPA: 2'-5' RNA ligase family protein [Sphingomicrobium sp.]|nr:2'-5' RNA ligase family protein [Sphingomicrobium sp.]
MAGALIVTAAIGAADLAWLNRLRQAHYPGDRNHVPAHLTIFHALPPSAESEVRQRVSQCARGPRPRARIEGLMDLGGGVAFRVVSEDLDALREALAEDLHGLLGAQDARGWRPHVTIQNKVAPKEARALIAALQRDFVTRPLAIKGLELHRYLDPGWERLAAFPFQQA